MSKRILSLVLALVMVLGTFGTVFAAETGNEKIDWLVDQGIVKGDASGNLMLDKNIDRASVAKLVVEALGQTTAAAGMQGIKSVFADVPANHWSNGNINVVHGLGLMIGNNGKFMPSATISYAEVVTILVRMSNGFTAEEEKTAVWPASYIAKANELGILDDVVVANFSAAAVRKDILEMFYNAMVNKEVGKYSIVKAIVLENNRVATLNKDEVVVEIIEEVQRAQYVTESRDKKGDQISLTIQAKVADVENLLGKVANFTLDKNGNVVKVTVDETYKYVAGSLAAIEDALKVDDTEYTVIRDERVDKRDDRIFRTYLNNKSYKYNSFAEARKYTDKNVTEADYAKVTVKNGKVLFIDAFNFEDIAPVKEVKKDGAEVFVYNDSRDGGVKTIDLSATAKVMTVKDGVFSQATREAIEANDVIHVYNGGFVVRKDSKVDGKYEKVSYSRDKDSNVDERVYVNVDGERYQVLPTANKKPVYSYDAKQFFTLETKGIDSTLRDFKDEKVTLLLDINGNLQFMTSEIELGEFAAIISNIIGKEVRVLKGTENTKAEYTATLDSDLLITGSTGHKNLNAFEAGDVVYMSANDGNIDTMLTLVSKNTVGTVVPNVTVNNTIKKDMASNYIKTDGKTYRILDRTNVFIRTGTVLKSTTMSDILNNYKVSSDDIIRASVLSDLAYNNALKAADVDFRRVNSALDDVAHTIVFTEISKKSTTYNYEVVKVLEKDRSGSDYELKVEFADKTTAYRTVKSVAAKAKYADINRGDIVELGVTKDDDKFVHEISIFIPTTAPIYEVTSVSSGTGYRGITLKDAANVSRNYWIFGEEFGYVQVGDKVSIYDENERNNHLETIIVRPSTSALSYWGGGSAGIVTDGVVTGFRYDSLKDIQYIEITKGIVVKEYEVRGLARNFVADLLNNDDEVKVIVDGNYLVGFEYIKLSGLGNRTVNALTVPTAWAGFILDGNGKTITNNAVFTVDADNATIKNVTFIGDVTVSSKVANDFTANNVTVNGTTTIAGGSSNTVRLIASDLLNVKVTKAGVRVRLEAGKVGNATVATTIGTLTIDTPATAAKVILEKDPTSEVTTVIDTNNTLVEEKVLKVAVSGVTYADNKVSVKFTVKELGLNNQPVKDIDNVKDKGTVSVVIKESGKTINTSKLSLDYTNGVYTQVLELNNTNIAAIKGKDVEITVTVTYGGVDYKGVATDTLLAE